MAGKPTGNQLYCSDCLQHRRSEHVGRKRKKIITHYSLVGLFILCFSCPCFDMYLLLLLQCLKALVAVLISALQILHTAVIYDVQSLILSRQQWRQFGIRRIGADMCKIKELQSWDVIGLYELCRPWVRQKIHTSSRVSVLKQSLTSDLSDKFSWGSWKEYENIPLAACWSEAGR